MMISKENEHIYYLLAGRLLWDDHFVKRLIEEPKHAITDTLIKAHIEFNEDQLEALVNEFEVFNAEYGLEKILITAKDYFSKGPEIAVV